MNLASFIDAHSEEILADWDAFAGTLVPAARLMSESALRDQARQILETIAQELKNQARTPGGAPSHGLSRHDLSKDVASEGGGSAASRHGTERESSGFTLEQLAAEYRSLRTSVLRLWLPQVASVTEETARDILGFNAAIDQSMAESVATFSEQATRARTTFLAILGHDLRSPLATITNAGAALTMPKSEKINTWDIGTRVRRSAATMTAMVNDLLEYAGSQLGSKMPIKRHYCDLKVVCQEALQDARAVHPECTFELDVSEPEDLSGWFDGGRLQQVITNLLNNAAQYRAEDRPVTVIVRGAPEAVSIEVWNFGPVIPTQSLQAIFEPLVQLEGQGHSEGRPFASLGLGLFIAREITLSHNGTITAESSENSGTVFTVRLPRNGSQGWSQSQGWSHTQGSSQTQT